ncbi:LysR family transcriptional regulator [Enterococcus pseudoavium]|uniref:LysR family transcriptional regulator n=1 Tax=Enterococcus pseudoavium TaxID=44007 RepID=A0ABU3FHH4_9ENTE|nr:LysR family transcriptional regulator [Enterococcus pseudoavium]MDT2770200.1 LysR family transcriptional regulator [Enterococcus pseudoavium]
MNLRQLEYFVLLAKSEHMTKAAKLANTSQPNVSHAMNVLEQELGVALFEKKGRNISLTRHGRIFYEYVQPALLELEKGQRRLQELINPTSGEIEFGFIYTMGSTLAPQLIQAFQQEEETSAIRFVFHQGNSNQIIRMLLEDTIDIGICSLISDDSNLAFQVLAQEELVLVVPEQHPLAQHDEIQLRETLMYPYVYYGKQSGLRPYLDRQLDNLGIELTVQCELEEDHSVLGFVGENYGIALMPNIPSIASYPVKKIKIKDGLEDRNIYLAVKKNNLEIPVLKKFYDFCLKKISQNGA